MLIVGCDDHPGFQQLLLWIPKLGNFRSGDCSIAGKRKSFTAIWQHEE